MKEGKLTCLYAFHTFLLLIFRSLSSLESTVNNTHMNLFTRYWCFVLSVNWHCKLVYFYSLYNFVFSVSHRYTVMWCVSGLWPFITNKLILIDLHVHDFTQETDVDQLSVTFSINLLLSISYLLRHSYTQ